MSMTPTRPGDAQGEVIEVASLDAQSIKAAVGAEVEVAGAHLPANVEQIVTALSDAAWDDVEDGHLGGTVTPRLPRLLLNRKVGQPESGFTDELTGDVFDSIEFVWLADTMTRAWFPLPFGKGDKEPACRSRDGLKPDPSSPAQQPGWQLPAPAGKDGPKGEVPARVCADCPNSRWENGETPACNGGVEVMAYLKDQQRLTLIRFGGMAVSRVNRYLGALEAHIPRRPPLAYVTRCTLEPVTTDNGTFLVPVFTPVGDIPREFASPMIEMRRQKVAEWQEQLAAEVIEGAVREDVPQRGPFDGDGLDPTRPFTDDEGGEQEEMF